MTPWRLQCTTGLRLIRDCVRIGDSLVVAGQAKGRHPDAVIEYQSGTQPTGPPIYQYDLAGGMGGAAVAESTVDADEINALLPIDDVVYAVGCQEAFEDQPYGSWGGNEPLDGKGALWTRASDGTWSGGSIYSTAAPVDSILEVVFWSGELWLRTRRMVWRRTTDGRLFPTALRAYSLFNIGDDLCAIADDRRGSERLTTYVWNNHTWTPWGAYPMPEYEIKDVTPPAQQPACRRVMGKPHVLRNEDLGSGLDYQYGLVAYRYASQIGATHPLYQQWQLEWERTVKNVDGVERVYWIRRTTPLTQEALTWHGHIYKTTPPGLARQMTVKPLQPIRGLAFAPQLGMNHLDRLHVPEGLPFAPGFNATIHIWPWSHQERLLPNLTASEFPSAGRTYNSIDLVRDSEGIPSYQATTIDCETETHEITALRKTAGRLYAGVVDRLVSDIIAFEDLYPWPEFQDHVEAQFGSLAGIYTRYRSPFGDPTALWEGTLQEGSSALPADDYSPFWELPLADAEFRWGQLPGQQGDYYLPGSYAPTDDVRAWLYALSPAAIRKVVAHGDGWVAASAFDGWLFGWRPTGEMQELFDAGAAITDIASFSDTLWVAAGGLVVESTGLGGYQDSLTPGDGFAAETLIEYGGTLYLVAPGDASTEVWSTDGMTWTLEATRSAVLSRAVVFDGKLWMGGEGDLHVFDGSSWSTFAAGSWSGTETISSMTCSTTHLYVGTDAGRIAWCDGTTPAAWTENAPGDAGWPILATEDVTALGWDEGELWFGLDDSEGWSNGFIAVPLPASNSWWVYGDEGERRVWSWADPPSGGSPGLTTVQAGREAIHRLRISTDGHGGATIKYWYSEPFAVEGVATRAAAQIADIVHDDELGLYLYMELLRYARWFSTAFAQALPEGKLLLSNRYAVMALDENAWILAILRNKEYGASLFGTYMSAGGPLIVPCPAIPQRVMARVREENPDSSMERWVTTSVDSYDLADYQYLDEGVWAQLDMPSSPLVRFALRFLD
ncbi:MAG: hypothetical protein GF320_02455, partial [Armatimonadia bacterium]|nr:hypothetical protein [Armatimonadia bacterium]